MNTFINAALRDLTCVATAAAITVVLGMAFVQSTNNAPGTPAHAVHTVAHVAVVAPLSA